MDLAVQAVVIAGCALEGLAWQEPQMSVAFGLLIIALAAVVLRRRAPAYAALLAGPAMGVNWVVLAPMVLLFTAGHRERRGWVVVALVAWTVLTATVFSPRPSAQLLDAQALLRMSADGLAGAVMVAGAAGLGRLVRIRAEQVAAIRELFAGRLREQALAQHAARVEERAALAREMHDVVASQVTLIAVQAGALRMIADGDPRLQEVAETIRAAAARTTRELREVLIALRTSPSSEHPAVSQVGSQASPSVAPSLGPPEPEVSLVGVRRLWQDSGCRGELVVHLPVGVDVPAGVQHAGYRVIQEGLTNTTRYAPGAQVRVGVEVVSSTVVLSVINGPALAEGAPSPLAEELAQRSGSREQLGGLSTGHGLMGVRERAEAGGGHASWGPLDNGGFQLVVVLPLPG